MEVWGDLRQASRMCMNLFNRPVLSSLGWAEPVKITASGEVETILKGRAQIDFHLIALKSQYFIGGIRLCRYMFRPLKVRSTKWINFDGKLKIKHQFRRFTDDLELKLVFLAIFFIFLSLWNARDCREAPWRRIHQSNRQSWIPVFPPGANSKAS